MVLPGFGVVETLLLLAVPFSVVVLAAFLVAVPLASGAPVLLGGPVAIGAAAVTLLVSGYAGVAFLAFPVCALAYRRVGDEAHPDGDLAPETAARNTRENLAPSREVIERRGREGTVLVPLLALVVLAITP